MLTRGLVLFALVSVAASWAFGLAAYMLKEQLGQAANLFAIGMLVVPFIMAYVCQRFTGAAGNPFRGLTWGNTSWYFAAWLLGILGGFLVMLVALGLNFTALDLDMNAYIQLAAEQSKQRGQPLPETAHGVLRGVGWATVALSPTLGPWFGALFGVLGTLPWLGWFARRALVFGRGTMVLLMVVLYALTSAPAGLMDSPAWAEVPPLLRVLLLGASGAALTPAVLWIFLRTRSAVIPALAQASYSGAFSAFMPITGDSNPLFAPPAGLLVPLGSLLAGIALWVWQDPGGEKLAVAAVAEDGTPLTPEQLKSLKPPE